MIYYREKTCCHFHIQFCNQQSRYIIVCSVLPSMHTMYMYIHTCTCMCKACQPSVHIFFDVGMGMTKKTFDMAKGPSQTMPSSHALNFAWGDTKCFAGINTRFFAEEGNYNMRYIAHPNLLGGSEGILSPENFEIYNVQDCFWWLLRPHTQMKSWFNYRL